MNLLNAITREFFEISQKDDPDEMLEVISNERRSSSPVEARLTADDSKQLLHMSRGEIGRITEYATDFFLKCNALHAASQRNFVLWYSKKLKGGEELRKKLAL